MKLAKLFLDREINDVLKLLKLIKKNKNNSFISLCEDGVKAIKKQKKIIFFGNGGSASDAQHLATELTCRFKYNRKSLPGLSLTTDSSAITAIGNDYDFKYIFSRQLEGLGQEGDLALAITTSGNSLNLIEAAKIAKKKKIKIYAISGNNGGKIKRYVDQAIIIPSKITSQIQVVEILIGQMFCAYLESYFLSSVDKKKFLMDR